MQIDIFVHTYDLSVLTSVITAGERGQRLNSSEWRLLKPLAAEITSQEQFLDAYGCGPPLLDAFLLPTA